MPKDVDLTKLTAQQQLHRAQVTGRAPPVQQTTPGGRPAAPARPAGVQRMPAPANPHPAIRGDLPLPQGKPLGARAAGVQPLTPTEIAGLRAAGIDPNEPVPRNMAAILQEVAGELHNLPPPVDPRTPPLKVNVQDIRTLSPEQQQRTRQMMQAALDDEAYEAQKRQQQAQRAGRPQGVQAALDQLEVQDDLRQRPPPGAPLQATGTAHIGPGAEPRYDKLPPAPPGAAQAAGPIEMDFGNQPWAQAGAQLRAQAQQTAAPAPGASIDDWQARQNELLAKQQQLDWEREQLSIRQQMAAAPPPEPPPPPPAAPPETPDPDPTGAAAPMGACPHCQWPLDQPDIPEPQHFEKISFLQAVLGGKPFLHEVAVLGGAVKFTFRTLTVGEVDAAHQQAFKDVESGVVATRIDYYERVNRYRLYLQLQSLRMAGGPGAAPIHHDLPDGLSPETNPKAQAHYKFTPVTDLGQTVLPFVEMHILGQVLTTEHLFRMAMFQLTQFNRLASKLEGMMDSTNFWRATAPQS